MTRWIIIYVLSCVALMAYVAVPDLRQGVDLNIAVDRTAILEAADEATAGRGRVGEDYRTAVAFQSSDTVLRFVQMSEGVDALQRHMDNDHLVPWTWCARHFREGELQEFKTCFRPDGRLLTWDDRIAEDAPGAALEVTAARALAHTALTETLSMDLTRWVEVTHRQATRSSGRIDHTFVWRLKDVSIDGASPNVSVDVQGSQITSVKRWMKVPKAFLDDYSRMRTANETLSGPGLQWQFTLAPLVALVLLVRARRERITWRGPLMLGLLIGAGYFAAGIAMFPQHVYSYDTATSWDTMVGKHVIGSIFTALSKGVPIALAAAGFHVLAKRWRPHDVAWWSLSQPEIWGTTNFLRQFALGSGLALVALTYSTGFYWSFTYWGSYRPTGAQEALPLLASWAPSLQALVIAHKAGIAEELAFRGLLLVGMVIWARGRTHEKMWVWLALLAQAVLFASAHANYPQQPSYTRILELTPMWFFFGWLALRVGLLPLVFMHVAIDLVLFSTSLFEAGHYGSWMLNMSVLWLPLLLFGLSRGRGWAAAGIPTESTWAGWTPRTIQLDLSPTSSKVSSGLWVTAALLAVVGAVEHARTISSDWTRPVYTMTRTDAIARSAEFLQARNIALTDRTPIVRRHLAQWTDAHAHAWDVAPAKYEALVAETWSPLDGPGYRVYWNTWGVRDMWRTTILPQESAAPVFRYRHLVDDDEPDGPTSSNDVVRMTRTAALERCTTELTDDVALSTDTIDLVQASQNERRDRRDWNIVFRDTRWEPLDVRMICDLRGEMLYRSSFIEIPEAWEREHQAETHAKETRQGMSAIPLLLVLLAGGVSLVRSGGHGLRRKTWMVAVGLSSVVTLAAAINDWPSTLAGFDEVREFWPQVGVGVGLALTQAAVFASLNGTAQWLIWGASASSNRRVPPIVVGLVASCALAAPDGMLDLWSLWSEHPESAPRTPSWEAVLAWSPALAVVLERLMGWQETFIIMGLLASALRWKGRAGHLMVVLVVAALMGLAGEWMAGLGVVGVMLIATCPASIPWLAMWDVLPACLHEMVYPYAPGVRLGALLSVVLLVGLAWAVHRIWPAHAEDIHASSA